MQTLSIKFWNNSCLSGSEHLHLSVELTQLQSVFEVVVVIQEREYPFKIEK